MAGWPTVPRDASPHPLCATLSLLPGLFLTGVCPPLSGFFLSSLCVFLFIPLTYLLPTVIPSHALALEQASLSLHLAVLSFSLVSASVLLPAYLASLLRASQSVLVLISSLQVHLSGSSYWNMQFVWLVLSPCIPITGCTLTSQPYEIPFPWDFMVCTKVSFFLCVHLLPPLPSLSVSHHMFLWQVTQFSEGPPESILTSRSLSCCLHVHCHMRSCTS